MTLNYNDDNGDDNANNANHYEHDDTGDDGNDAKHDDDADKHWQIQFSGFSVFRVVEPISYNRDNIEKLNI